MSYQRGLAGFVALALVVASCGGSGDGADPASIGPAGGTVASDDGALTLTIPPGALSDEVTIEISSPTRMPEVFSESAPLAIYRMEPDGLTFDVPVTFTLELTLAPPGPDGAITAPIVFLLTDETVESVSGSVEIVLGAASATASGTLDHFSWIVGHDGPLTVALEDQDPRTKPVGETWEANVRVISTTRFASLSIGDIPFAAGGSVEIVGTESHQGFTLDSGEEQMLDLPTPRWKCAAAGAGHYGVSVMAQLGGDLISGFLYHLREFGEPLQPVAARNEWGVALNVPIECVASEPTSTTTSSTTTTTTTTVPEALATGEIQCEWYRIEYEAIPAEAVMLLAMGDIQALRRDYAELAESLGYGEAPPLPAGPPPLETWLPPDEPMTFDEASDSIGAWFLQWLCGRGWHSDGIMETVSQGATDIIGTATAVVDAGDAGVEQTFGNTNYPCGSGEFGYTLCGDLPYPAGPSLVVAMALGGNVPVDDPEQHYQYGFVFDSDGDPSNDYQASPQFPMDFFDGTDLWYVADYDPSAGWFLGASGENFAPLPTAARVVIVDYGMLLVVPVSEIGDLAAAGYRVTAFRHLGDYGMNPPHVWNGDTLPAVGEPLAGIASVAE